MGDDSGRQDRGQDRRQPLDLVRVVRRLVHELRGRMDAIVVGIGTVVADDPLLTARPPGPRSPTRVVLDSAAHCRSRPSWSRPPAMPRSGGRHRARPTRSDVRSFAISAARSSSFQVRPRSDRPSARRARAARMTNVLVEGGGQVLGSFLDEQQVDEVDVFIAPIIEGGDHANTPSRGIGCLAMSDAFRLGRARDHAG